MTQTTFLSTYIQNEFPALVMQFWRLYLTEACVLGILLYGSEKWTLYTSKNPD